MNILSDSLLFLTAGTYSLLLYLVLSSKTNWNNKNDRFSRASFAAMVFSLLLWTVACYFFTHTSGEQIYTTMVMGLPTFVPTTLLCFVGFFLNIWDKWSLRLSMGILLFANIFFLGISFIPGALVIMVTTVSGAPATLEVGPFYPFYGLYYTIGLIMSALFLIQAYRSTSHLLRRRQILFVLLGIITSFSLAVFVSIALIYFFGNSSWGWLGPDFTLFLVGGSLYAMYQYQFLDMRLNFSHIFKKTLAFFSSCLVFLIAFRFAFFLGFPHGFSLFLALIPFLASFSFFKTLLNRVPFHRLFGYHSGDQYRYIFKKYRELVISSPSVVTLDAVVKNCFEKKLQISPTRILFFLEKDKEMQSLAHFCSQYPDPLVRRDVLLQEEETAIHSLLRSQKASLIFPLYHQATKKIIAFFLIGKKSTSDKYSQQEISLFEEAARYTALSLTGMLYSSELEKEVLEKTEDLRQKNDHIKKLLDDVQEQSEHALQSEKKYRKIVEDFNERLQEEVRTKTEKLQKSYEQLKTLDHAKDEFISLASHELRTPMTVIQGYASLLLQKKFGPLNEKQERFLQKTLHQTSNLIHLVNDMLDLGKLEANMMSSRPENILPSSFLLALSDEFHTMCSPKNITFQIFYEKKHKDSSLLADKNMLKHILSNLMGNAVKFTKEEGNIQISFSPDTEKKEMILSIRDDGIGIAKEDQERIFDRFYQVGNTLQREHESTGLGLSIVKQMLEKMKGSVSVESEIGEGALFVLRLPLVNEAKERVNYSI